MSPLEGFTDNPFRSKDDFTTATESLLRPLLPYFSTHKARIRISTTSGAHFDENAAQLEGYARPLWAVAAILADPDCHDERDALLRPWIHGLQQGVDPDSPEYWGAMEDWDQRMVEAEIISFALLTAPDAFYNPLPEECKRHVAAWLKGINGKVMPVNNWRWFRVLSNLALIKVCGVPRDEVWHYMEEDFETLELFYLSNGWAADGPWRPFTDANHDAETAESASQGRQADYYSGSFAIQFSQLLYSKLAADLDPKRAELFRDGARLFLSTFWKYFDTDGASIPFGRSLTYRFAMGAFYAAFAYAGLCDDSDQLSSHGSVKGMLLRHMRWWAKTSKDIFNTDGTLTIGYLYPNMFMCEDYNSPQSPYWALKTLIVAGLSTNDSFWTAEELPHPLANKSRLVRDESTGVSVVKPARQILCNHPGGSHHFLLSSGQFVVWPMKAAQAKYSKFAYSSAFGFSVPTGTLIAQIAPDSTLAMSQDEGETWAVRWASLGDTRITEISIRDNSVKGSKVPALVSRWRPWKSRGVEVETTLIAPSDYRPDWHIRVHRIRGGSQDMPPGAKFHTVEGGFAIDGCAASDGRSLWKKRVHAAWDASLDSLGFHTEGALETSVSSLIFSKAGVSGVVDISPKAISNHIAIENTVGEILKSDSNTNLMATRTLIPTIKRTCQKWPEGEIVIATAVFAVAFTSEAIPLSHIEARWDDVPILSWGPNGELVFQ